VSAQPAVSVVVPTRDRAGYLRVCLASIAAQQLAEPFEIVVVDDGSADDTPAVAERAGAELVRLPGPRGPNAARNAGVARSRAGLVAFVDDDVEAPPGWLGAVVEGARRHPGADAFGGPIHARLEGPSPRSCGREPAPITTLDLGIEDHETERVWGANMALRRSAFERIGGFDDRLPQFGEEEEWLTRLRAGGGRVMYLAAAGLDHRRAGDDARLGRLMRGAYVRGRNLREHDVRRGAAPTLGRELRVLAGCGWHTLRRACPQGLIMGAHSLGRTVAAARPRQAS
jgi:glycosyltransferase involved in cell wall biosynthesis